MSDCFFMTNDFTTFGLRNEGTGFNTAGMASYKP